MSTQGCDCCVGIDAATPRRIENPPGLPAISYRAGRHGYFLESLIARLSSADSPALAALTTREASDFTIALSDALAGHLDVLSFYAERYANEHYLRTSTERLSVLEMARLIGYELAPGVAAGTHLAFTLQSAPGAPSEPITIPVGTRVQSVPGQDEEAQTFETVGPASARAVWNAIAPQQSSALLPVAGDTGLWLLGAATELDEGDLILILGDEYTAGAGDERWAARVLTEVRTDDDRALTFVAWRDPLGSDRPFALLPDEGALVYAFRTRTAAFGSNAPDWRALSDEAKASYIGLANPEDLQRPGDTEEWPEFTVLAPVYPERREGGAILQPVPILATIEDIAAAANGAAQAAAAAAMHKAAGAGTGMVMTGGQLAENAMTLARQSAAGLADVAKLAVNEVTQRARTLIHAQGQTLQALRLSANQLVQHSAFDHARQIIGDRIAGLPARIEAFAALGTTDPLEVASKVLEELETAWDAEVPAAFLPDLQPVWEEAVAAVDSAIVDVQSELEDDSGGGPNWLAAGASALESAGNALTRVADVLDSVEPDFDADGDTAANIVRDIVTQLKDSIGEELSNTDLTDLLNLAGTAATVQDWTASLLESGGTVGEGLLRLQQNITGAAGVLFTRLGQDVTAMASEARSAVADTGELLNPAAALGALNEAATDLRNSTTEAGAAALSAAAASDVAALVTTAVAVARSLPAQFAPTTPEELAAIVRHFAAAGVARAGGSPLGPVADEDTIAQIEALLPAPLQAPFEVAAPLLALMNDADALLDAPRNGAEAAYEQIVAHVDKTLQGTLVYLSGRRTPLIRSPDRIDLSPINDDILADTWALLTVPDTQALYRIIDVETASRAEYLMSGQTTRMRLSDDVPSELDTVRSLVVYAESEELAVARVPLEIPVYGTMIALDEHVDGLAPGQPFAISGQRPRIRLARDADGLTLVAEDGSTRTLSGGDSLLLVAAPVRLIGTTPHYLDPAAFGAAIGNRGIRLRLELQDRDGLVGRVEPRGDQIALASPLEDDPEIREVAFLLDTEDAVTHDRDRSYLNLVDPTGHCYARRGARLNGNVAPATHGETVEAILGDGDGSRANQQFALNQSPLTYVSANTPNGRASTLEVRVNDVLWTETPSLYQMTPDARRYATRTSDEAVTTVQFGDGMEGARLPSGPSNLRVRYRKYLGVAGNVAADKLTTLLSRPLGVSEVVNPEAATGGEDAETLDRARDNAPLTVLTLERAVSIDDYANFARAFAGIDKAHALWIPVGPARGVFLTIAGVDGAHVPASGDTFVNLSAALKDYGDPLVPLRMDNFSDVRFACRLSVKVLGDYEAEPVLDGASEALRGHFGFAARRFGQPVSVDEVAAVAQAVPGVEAVHVTRLHRMDRPIGLEPRLFATVPVASLTALPAPAELLTLAESPIEIEVLP